MRRHPTAPDKRCESSTDFSSSKRSLILKNAFATPPCLLRLKHRISSEKSDPQKFSESRMPPRKSVGCRFSVSFIFCRASRCPTSKHSKRTRPLESDSPAKALGAKNCFLTKSVQNAPHSVAENRFITYHQSPSYCRHHFEKSVTFSFVTVLFSDVFFCIVRQAKAQEDKHRFSSAFAPFI